MIQDLDLDSTSWILESLILMECVLIGWDGMVSWITRGEESLIQRWELSVTLNSNAKAQVRHANWKANSGYQVRCVAAKSSDEILGPVLEANANCWSCFSYCSIGVTGLVHNWCLGGVSPSERES